MWQSYHKLPNKPEEKICWQNLYGSSQSLVIAQAAQSQPLIVITPDILTANRLAAEINFFQQTSKPVPVLIFPDWETLPYDHFSPHQDIISERLLTLYQLPQLKHGVLLIAASTLMYQLAPTEYITANSFVLSCQEPLDIAQLRSRLESAGYRCVAKVMEHGEFAVRGSIVDLFPMGSTEPYRIDLLDNVIDTIRTFDPDTQRSITKIPAIKLLPAKEYPLTTEAVSTFRQQWRTTFLGDPTKCPIYQSVSNQQSYPGIEYYLTLFFNQTNSLFDYLPKTSVIINACNNLHTIFEAYWQKITERYTQLAHDKLRPILPPASVFIPTDQIHAHINKFPQVLVNPENQCNFATHCFLTKDFLHDSLTIDNRAGNPLHKLSDFLKSCAARVLIVAESLGRRENLLELLQTIQVIPAAVASWEEFTQTNVPVGITVAPLEQGLWWLPENNQPAIIVIPEALLFGQQVMQRRLRKPKLQDPEAIVRDLAELQIGAPVVHLDFGIGRYLGLQTLTTDKQTTEFLVLEYADAAKLYVPVAALHLISRYTGIDAEHAPLHHLGSKQWDKAKREALAKIRDVAAELLEIYARRQANLGHAFKAPDTDYQRFAAAFPFEETPDQTRAIADVMQDMTQARPMDRLICGDVGFGKTEVAMRAAFLAAHSGKQVVLLAPTTLLAQQHYTTFQDRFADWPIKIELLSRFRSAKDQQNILQHLQEGKIDIVIGTHKLLQPSVQFKNLGLLIVDEEHRFGVKQKEHLKKIRPNIDILTLTATPIPRTLNMAFANIRDFSIIATPPEKRLAIKTFVHQRENYLIKEAILREILRGGQVYFLHNDIATIEKTARELENLVPTARIAVAHGQMREHQLEFIMRDFYHLRSNILVCTTIIESGIDIPTANTIIIDRADKFGLAQLHQLRGRVGRSHHQAYAYLLIPPPTLLTPDAKKRLEVIAAMEDLGSGFMLATHDLEIRGAGELLGEEQSGEIQSIGFNLYMDLLERAIKTLKAGKSLDLVESLEKPLEIDLQIPALIPEKYLADVNARLVLYKRIANASALEDLTELQVEMVDRFGPLPEATKNLFKIGEIRLAAQKLGVHKITLGTQKGNIEFVAQPNIDAGAIIKLVQKEAATYKIKKSNQLEFVLKEATPSFKIAFLQQLLTQLSMGIQ